MNSEELDAQGLPQLDTADVSPAERLAFERLLGDLSALFAEVTRLKERLMAENHYLRQSAAARSGQLPTSRSPVFNQVLEEIAAVAPTCSTVLLRGETGSGKEVLADAIHALSGRRERPLIKVNCAALPASLIEAELFGLLPAECLSDRGPGTARAPRGHRPAGLGIRQ